MGSIICHKRIAVLLEFQESKTTAMNAAALDQNEGFVLCHQFEYDGNRDVLE